MILINKNAMNTLTPILNCASGGKFSFATTQATNNNAKRKMNFILFIYFSSLTQISFVLIFLLEQISISDFCIYG